MGSNEQGLVLYTQDGILLKKSSASHILQLNTSGNLSVTLYEGHGNWIEWTPANEGIVIAHSNTQDDWSLVDTISKIPNDEHVFRSKENVMPKDKNQNTTACRVIKVKISDLKSIEILNSSHEIKLITMDGRTHSQYFFQHGNTDSFVKNLQSLHCLQQKRRNKYLYDIYEKNDDEEKLKIKRTFDELKIEEIKSASSSGFLDFFAKIADFVPPITQVPQISQSTSSYEVSACSSKSHDSYKEIYREVLPDRPNTSREKPLNEMQWKSLMANDGSITSNIIQIKQIIFHGGIEANLRPTVWKYLLDDTECWKLTSDQLFEYRKRKTDEYFQMKVQWRTFTKVQENNFSDYRDRKCQIEKDVKRTDRTELFFSGEDNSNLIILEHILMTYVMYNFDLGYVQGMSDLLAPILCVLQNEPDSFWCFVGFMKSVFLNFDIDQKGMKKQLQDLNHLISFACPRLFSYLVKSGSENMYFCFRWLLVWFKREFSNPDIMELWEVLWTGLPCPNFHLLICVAILDQQTNIFIEQNYEFNDILKHVNELSLKIDLKKCLEDAEAIYYQLTAATNLTDEIRLLIGLEPVNSFDKTPASDGSSEDIRENACEYAINNSFL